MNSSIEPWLSIREAEQAVEFYKNAFHAKETYRLSDPENGIVVRLRVGEAGFWVSSDHSSDSGKDEPIGGNSIRMILIVEDPSILFQSAITHGATTIFPIGEDHGWKLGRIQDPFGLHWEIGHQI
ncbi:MAG: VOC family protein [Bacteroidota bacterium]|nr:VOC family protein [Bacteroidota bacterium]